MVEYRPSVPDEKRSSWEARKRFVPFKATGLREGDRDTCEKLYPGTILFISHNTASGSKLLTLGSRFRPASQTACRSASPDCAPRD
jgi:hypothetical protein